MKLTAARAAFRPSRAGLYLPLGRTCAKSGAAVTDSANTVRGSWGFVCVFKYLTTIIIRFEVGVNTYKIGALGKENIGNGSDEKELEEFPLS